MIVPTVVIIILLYIIMYQYYYPDNSSSSQNQHNYTAYRMQPQASSCGAPADVNYQNNHHQVQSIRRQPELPVSENQSREEYMTNKFDTSYQQATASLPNATNYHEYMVSTGLEPSVVASHKDFTDETQNKTTGASTETVFSHDDAIVPSWGLRRTSANVPINPNSREVPSQTNEQLADNTRTFKYGLF